MNNVKVILNKQGLIEMLKSDEMMSVVVSRAQSMVGSDQEIETFVGFDRVHATIRNTGGLNADRSAGDPAPKQ